MEKCDNITRKKQNKRKFMPQNDFFKYSVARLKGKREKPKRKRKDTV